MNSVSISSYFEILGLSQKAYSRCLEPVCRKWDLKRSELDVLLFLFNNPELNRAADIVTHRGIAKSHVSLSVTHLRSMGLLEQKTSPSDRRNSHLILTESGRRIAEDGRIAQNLFFEKIYAGISPEELSHWRAIREKIEKNIENL